MSSALDVDKLPRVDRELSSVARLLRAAVEDDSFAQRVVEARLKTPTEEEPDRVDLAALGDFLDLELRDPPRGR